MEVSIFNIECVVGAFIALGATFGQYGAGSISYYGLSGQKAEQDNWCVFAAMKTMGVLYSQCELATEYIKLHFKDDSLTGNCCKDLLDMSLEDYNFWVNYCLHGVMIGDVENLIMKYLVLRKLNGTLINNLVFPYFDLNKLFPCLGINRTIGHAIVLSGACVYGSASTGQLGNIEIYYFDPGYGKEVMQTITNINNAPYIECYYSY